MNLGKYIKFLNQYGFGTVILKLYFFCCATIASIISGSTKGFLLYEHLKLLLKFEEKTYGLKTAS